MTIQSLTDEEIDAIESRARIREIDGKPFGVSPVELGLRYRDDVSRLLAEIRWLRAVLDGDPEQTATPDQRRAWRRSAIRYADKVEAELKALRLDEVALAEIVFWEDTAGKGFREIAARLRSIISERDEALQHLDAIIAALQQPGLGSLMVTIRLAKEWRGVK